MWVTPSDPIERCSMWNNRLLIQPSLAIWPLSKQLFAILLSGVLLSGEAVADPQDLGRWTMTEFQTTNNHDGAPQISDTGS